jgi:hypothetical protein
VHNLRSALDILAVELTRLGLQREDKEMSRTKFDDAGFYIAANRDKFEEKFAKSTQHWSDPAKDFYRALEPFKDGGHQFSRILWNLHKLDILDKHKLLITLGTMSSDFKLSFGIVGVPEGGPDVVSPQLRFGPVVEERVQLQSGDELFTYWTDGAELQIKMRTALSVSISEAEIIDRTTVFDALQGMLGATDFVVENLAALGA